jgi:O-acetyl-ADP-ribose deacetylase (regulator of RNase III)
MRKASISLVMGDITRQTTDAIVNAANSQLIGGGGVDGAIHAAGGPAILDECKDIIAKMGSLLPGQAVVTGGGKLFARYVIHTVGPIWQGGHNQEADLLASAYLESLKLAEKLGLQSIAFPSISTGAYGYPLEEAASIAIDTIIDFAGKQARSLEKISIVLFNQKAFQVYTHALAERHN